MPTAENAASGRAMPANDVLRFVLQPHPLGQLGAVLGGHAEVEADALVRGIHRQADRHLVRFVDQASICCVYTFIIASIWA